MKSLKYPITLEYSPSKEHSLSLLTQLGEYNKSLCSSYKNAISYGFFIKDLDNILGGAEGKLWIGSIRIDRLLVHSSLRGKGYGKELLRKIEELGRTNSASVVVLENLSFQDTLDFYLKHGYTITFQEEGYIENTVMYHLRKKLL